ncbi:hypothetical protein L9F63_003370 [Diploptera punctata]|uniref:Uncharacterized protein n=1 Tax=Diploptera punctata TaxID=6984 RepID=A0AAD7ZKZ7_DIPPU|nr:hypothetical protein L9F63_003370 [Diploptera punctata]
MFITKIRSATIDTIDLSVRNTRQVQKGSNTQTLSQMWPPPPPLAPGSWPSLRSPTLTRIPSNQRPLGILESASSQLFVNKRPPAFHVPSSNPLRNPKPPSLLGASSSFFTSKKPPGFESHSSFLIPNNKSPENLEFSSSFKSNYRTPGLLEDPKLATSHRPLTILDQQLHSFKDDLGSIHSNFNKIPQNLQRPNTGTENSIFNSQIYDTTIRKPQTSDTYLSESSFVPQSHRDNAFQNPAQLFGNDNKLKEISFPQDTSSSTGPRQNQFTGNTFTKVNNWDNFSNQNSFGHSSSSQQNNPQLFSSADAKLQTSFSSALENENNQKGSGILIDSFSGTRQNQASGNAFTNPTKWEDFSNQNSFRQSSNNAQENSQLLSTSDTKSQNSFSTRSPFFTDFEPHKIRNSINQSSYDIEPLVQFSQSIQASEHHSTYHVSPSLDQHISALTLTKAPDLGSSATDTYLRTTTAPEHKKKLTLKDILAEDCPDAKNDGYCASPPRYPTSQVLKVIARCADVLQALYVPEPEDDNDTLTGFNINITNTIERGNRHVWSWAHPGDSQRTVCDSDRHRIEPGYVKDARTGHWYVVLQATSLSQRVTVDICKAPGKPCTLAKCTRGVVVSGTGLPSLVFVFNDTLIHI